MQSSMLNIRGLKMACIREVDCNSVRRKEEVTVYYWFFVFSSPFLILVTPLWSLLYTFGICILWCLSLALGLEDRIVSL